MVEIKVKNECTTEITISGTVLSVDDEKIVVEEEKHGVQEFELSVLKNFIGKDIKLKLVNKEDIVIEE